MVSRSITTTSLSLLERVRQHDRDAWRRFADLYSPLVYAWARRGGLQDTDSADLVQDVFRIVATKLDQFGREGAGFRNWLRAITRNLIRLHYRRQAGRPEAEGGSAAGKRIAGLPDEFEQESDLSTVDDLRFLLHHAVELVRAEFEASTWQAFWRTVVDVDSAPEVAAALNMTPGAVRQAKYRVLRRLRAELAE